ncbi:MAG: hypothetical protein DME25_07890 [Verrucomicrobia bacterium]|nr:MAG: hypothetical protein DME25_07890 [Verrucomicrobiota bacterium]
MTLTLVHSNAYVIEMAQASATITSHDNLGTNIFVPIKPSSFGDVTGLDYHSPTRSLIAGLSSAGSGSGNFLSIDTNSAVTSWSGVNQSVGELKFAIVKQSANGFTNGAIYFNSESNSAFPGVIGRVSSNGSAWSTNWATLTNEPLLLQGGFYVDQTGVFSNNLIVVSGVDTNDGARIWQVDAAGNATNLAFLPLVHCEGVITLSNDVARWGPWAGKILTGAENTAGCPSADLIFAINTNGAVASFDLGISAEHFDLIPADQDLYLSLEGAADSIVKLPRTLLSQYVGDLLITQGGRYGGLAHSPGFFIVRWDGSRFTKRGIDLQFYSKGAYNIRGSGEIEGVSFAPIDSAP